MNIFSVFDTETTGFKPSEGARIIEIAVCKISSNGEVLGTFDTLLNVGEDASVGAEEIHKISPAMLLGAPKFTQIASSLFQFINGTILVAHNAPFDKSFLSAEMNNAGFDTASLFVADTLVAARKTLPGLSSYKLGELAKHLGITFEGNAHAALADAKVTAQLFTKLYELNSNLQWPTNAFFNQPDLLISESVPLKSRS